MLIMSNGKGDFNLEDPDRLPRSGDRWCMSPVCLEQCLGRGSFNEFFELNHILISSLLTIHYSMDFCQRKWPKCTHF